MLTLVRRGQVITPGQTLEDTALVIEGGRIAALLPDRQIAEHPLGAQVIDARGLSVLPGLIDLHVHGGAGGDTMDATPRALHAMARFFLRHGVTTYLATTITASPQDIRAAIANASGFSPAPDEAQPLGVHLEGPCLSAAYCGAQPVEWLRAPDPDEYLPWFDSPAVRLMTIAPELPGAERCIRDGISRGLRFSAGHTAATYAQLQRAVDAGLSQSTHTFNGMLGLHHREPGTAGAVLVDDRISAEIIADGVHVHPAVIKLVVRAKGTGRTLLVTDAMRAAGLGDGVYDLGGQSITVAGGVARTASGGLAGSTLTLNRAVFNVMHFAGLSLNQAVAMATTTPASILGLDGRKGVIRPGADADLILVDANLDVKAALVAGRLASWSLRCAKQGL